MKTWWLKRLFNFCHLKFIIDNLLLWKPAWLLPSGTAATVFRASSLCVWIFDPLSLAKAYEVNSHFCSHCTQMYGEGWYPYFARSDFCFSQVPPAGTCMCMSLGMCMEVWRHSNFQANFFVNNNIHNICANMLSVQLHGFSQSMHPHGVSTRSKTRTLSAPQNHSLLLSLGVGNG